MGIDVGDRFLVGLCYLDFPEEIFDEVEEKYEGEFVEWAEAKGLLYASPYYDAPQDECFYGYEISATNIKFVIDELQIQSDRFFELVKIPAIVYAGCNVY